MEPKEPTGTLPLDYIRGLLIAQGAKCAITGIPLEPVNVNADHIVPLSRTDLAPSMKKDNLWLVHKKINAMKGTMTYEELVQMARLILDHHEHSKRLLHSIRAGKVSACKKADFDKWVSTHCQADGLLKTTGALEAIAKSEETDA